MIEFATTLKKFDSKLWHYYIDVPQEIAQKLIIKKDRRVLCTLNNSITIPCAIMHRGEGDFFINLNKEVRSKLGLVVGESINIILKKDTSEYGMPMCDEFKELLAQDEEGNTHFDALTPGKQRNLIYIAGKLKNPEKRLHTSMGIVTHLKKQKGEIDFKELQVDIKEAKNRFNTEF